MKSITLPKGIIGILLCLFTFQINFTQAQTYQPGEKVEVRYEGEWYEGIYSSNLGEKYSNMKATPHSVKLETKYLNGNVNVAPRDIRKYTGTIKPKYTEAPEASTINTNRLENEVIDEVNFMRTKPREYARKLSKLKSKYVKVNGRGWYLDMLEAGGIFISDNDSDRYRHERALDEVIAELNSSKVLTRLTKNSKLRASANIMASDRGKINGPKHLDSRGRNPQDRAKITGYNGYVEENLYTGVTAFGLVGGYLIDFNVPSRGHRKSLMRGKAKEIGVACHYFPQSDYIRNVIHLAYGERDQNTSTTGQSRNGSTASTSTGRSSGSDRGRSSGSSSRNGNKTTSKSNGTSEFDSNAYYRLTCQWQGESKSLDIRNDGTNNQPVLSKTGNYSGQMWRIKKTGNGIYTLSTKWRGPSLILDCIQGPKQHRPVLNQESGYSGGAWKIIPVGNGYYRITNMWLNDKSLDVINDGKNNQIQVAKTGNYSGQMWKITKIR